MPDLPVDSAGFRHGHPVRGADTLSTAAAAEELGTTPMTVRTLICSGELDGYWQRPPGTKRYRYAVYTTAVAAFLEEQGRFEGRRRRRSAPLPALRRARSAVASLDESNLHREVAALRRDVAAVARRLDEVVLAIARPEAELNAERRRRVELEEALSAVEQADLRMAEADRARDEAVARLKDAYTVLRKHATGTRLPRSLADMPAVGNAGTAGTGP